VIGLDCSNAILCSAKEGIGIMDILNAIVARIPPPPDTSKRPLRALIFDSYYDAYRGVIVYFRVVDGTIKKGDRVSFMASGKDYFADEIGVLSPNQLQAEELFAGEVGYLSASIRTVADARVGDTITHHFRKADSSLPGYEEATPMVFCGLFPVDADQFPELRDALEKLQLNDAALKFEPETSSAMGFGFRCGFLGLLHMEIVQERLEREYNLSLITTAPSVVYRVNCVNGDTVECSNPSSLPEPGRRKSIEEPVVKIEMLTPKDYIGPLMELAQERRGQFKEMKFITEIRASLTYELPLAEMVGDFFDQLKSRSKGYASMEYTVIGYKESDLTKLDIQINGECVEPLATIVHRDKACLGAKVIASESLSAIRKDVLAKCYGGDITRKKKLLKKQAEGKKRMKSIGKVDVPQEAFMAVLKLEKEVI
ncbi:translation factor GUF1 chloroplastic-like, partial [Trifolium pratense]